MDNQTEEPQPSSPSAQPATDTSSGDTSTDDKASEPDRRAEQAWPYALSAVAFLVVPWLVGAAAPPSTATVVMLVFLPLAALVLGVLDGLVFRRTWAFPMITGLFCWMATQLYFNAGTWIYAAGVLALCVAGNALGARRTPKA